MLWRGRENSPSSLSKVPRRSILTLLIQGKVFLQICKRQFSNPALQQKHAVGGLVYPSFVGLYIPTTKEVYLFFVRNQEKELPLESVYLKNKTYEQTCCNRNSSIYYHRINYLSGSGRIV